LHPARSINAAPYSLFRAAVQALIRRFWIPLRVCGKASVLVSPMDDPTLRDDDANRPSWHERRHETARRIVREFGERPSKSDQLPWLSPMSWSGVQMTGIA
jgi:hypothetical protein